MDSALSRGEGGLRVLVCDDDPVVRQIVAQLATEAGHRVVAEAGQATEAIDAGQSQEIDIAVVDLSLTSGNGLNVVRELAQVAGRRAVVFSSFCGDHHTLLQAGAAVVIDKPDFAALEALLREWAQRPCDAPVERRGGGTRPVAPAPPSRSPSGLDSPAAFFAALADAGPDDALVLARIDDLDAIGAIDGPMVAADWLLELARAARRAVRTEDRAMILDEHQVALLLLGAGPRGTNAATRRLELAWDHAAQRHPAKITHAVCAPDESGAQLLERLRSHSDPA